METNMGSIDRAIRIAVAAVLVIIGLNMTMWAKWILFALAAILFITAAIGFCPLYTLCKCNTTGAQTKTTKPAAKKTTKKKR